MSYKNTYLILSNLKELSKEQIEELIYTINKYKLKGLGTDERLFCEYKVLPPNLNYLIVGNLSYVLLYNINFLIVDSIMCTNLAEFLLHLEQHFINNSQHSS